MGLLTIILVGIFGKVEDYNSDPLTSDNDPFSANSDHGAHVAGIATAEVRTTLLGLWVQVTIANIWR